MYNQQSKLDRTCVYPNLRFAAGYLVQQSCRNVWVEEFETSFVSGGDCPDPDFNFSDVLLE